MESLGINLGTILIQIINFGILVFVLNKYLYKPVLRSIKAKEQESANIEKQKIEVEALKEELIQKKSLLEKELEDKKREIIMSAKREAENEKRAIILKAENEAREIILKAQREIDSEVKALSKKYEEDVLNASFAISEKVMANLAEKKVREDTIKEAVRKLDTLRSELWKN